MKIDDVRSLILREGGEVVLFAFNPLRTAIPLLGGDKLGRWSESYRTAIPEAERLYAQHPRKLREERLWQDTGSSGIS